MQRGYGKTTQLIKNSAKTGDYIVCHGLDEAHRIHYEAKQMGLAIPLPITHREFIEKRYIGRNISGFLIDNIEMFIQSFSDVPVNAITIDLWPATIEIEWKKYLRSDIEKLNSL